MEAATPFLLPESLLVLRLLLLASLFMLQESRVIILWTLRRQLVRAWLPALPMSVPELKSSLRGLKLLRNAYSMW
ncbi:hypothetical protein [Streptomyces sp. NPDC058394]|uniref:hypothetical protein n=1 Tax=Streptomyces sp. NPDC058394 TaxID=3346477 RepID=UPI003662F466